ncbi:hypothetical protein [Streptomyces sp. NPDC091040]|uniref:hypothetical protein n=1 Tax=Streptomyces sp. NPDC091040 TaxID=3365972 RepID=UPI003811336E
MIAAFVWYASRQAAVDHSADDIGAESSWVTHTRLSSPRNPPMTPAVSRPPPDGSMETAIFYGSTFMLPSQIIRSAAGLRAPTRLQPAAGHPG